MFDEVMELIESKRAKIGIIGLGYVGLPLVREFTRAGFRVIGFDVNPVLVGKLNAGKSPIRHIPSELITELRETKQFEATCNFVRLDEPDCIIICVPTPLTPSRDPDLSHVEHAARQVARTLRAGQLVVLESTTYPGTTEEIVFPVLSEGRPICGTDWFLAYSPEREDPGNPNHTIGGIPKVVGGIDDKSARMAEKLYGALGIPVVLVGDCRTAEATKIMENTYRCVNIALVNELKIVFEKMGIDIWEVISAASTKPFGFQPFYPGPGLGGHCIPIDPFYLAWKAREVGASTKFIELAGEVNAAMPERVVARTQDALSARGWPLRNAHVLVLGVAYKPEVDDIRESPAFEIMESLELKGAVVDYHDPFVPSLGPTRRFPGFKKTSVALDERRLAMSDCVVVVTNHAQIDYDWVVEHSNFVVDARNATAGVTQGRDKIVKA